MMHTRTSETGCLRLFKLHLPIFLELGGYRGITVGLFNKLLDVLQAEYRTILDAPHGLKAFNTFEELLNFLTLVLFEVNDS